MTISSSPSHPLFVVLGATGNQGGSVVRAIHQSSLAYRVRAVTRDPSKPAAKELVEKFGSDAHVEVVAADVADADAKSLEDAFRDADVVFGLTLSDYGSPNSQVKEFEEGKRIVDAAHSAGVRKFVFSGLSDVKDMSNGRLELWTFDVKAAIVKYARSKAPSWEVYDVQPGFFASFVLSHYAPRASPANDGTYVFTLTMNPDTKMPVIDVESDYGRYVVGAVEKGVRDVYAGTEVTPVEIAKAFEEVSGKTVRFSQTPDEFLHDAVVKMMTPIAADAIVMMGKIVRETGYYGGKDMKESEETILNGPPKTFVEYLSDHREEVKKLLV